MMQTRAQVPREATAALRGAFPRIPQNSTRSLGHSPRAMVVRLALPFVAVPQGCDGFLPGARFPCLTSLNQTNLGTRTPRKTIPIFPSLQVHSQNQGTFRIFIRFTPHRLVIIREFVRKASCQQVAQFFSNTRFVDQTRYKHMLQEEANLDGTFLGLNYQVPLNTINEFP